MFLRKKNGMTRQRLTESARQSWYILDKQKVFGAMPEKLAGGILNTREDIECGNIMTMI